MEKAKTVSIAGSRPKTLPLSKLRLDGDTQSRLSLDEDVIKEYAGLMANGQEFPPLLVVFDGADYWLVDGFHRRWAAIKSKIEKLKCLVVEGTREDARWLSYGVNKDHGLQRTNEDKKKAVIAALKHPNGAKKSDRQIAEHVGVSHATVIKYRASLQSSGQIDQIETREVTRNGVTYEQNTANIGRAAAVVIDEEDEDEDEDDGYAFGGADVEFLHAGISKVAEPIRPPSPIEVAHFEKKPFEHLQYWWQKADSAARTRFRLWIDGECT